MQTDRVDPVTLARLRLQLCRAPRPVVHRPSRPFIPVPMLRQADDGETALSRDEVALGIELGLIASSGS